MSNSDCLHEYARGDVRWGMNGREVEGENRTIDIDIFFLDTCDAEKTISEQGIRCLSEREKKYVGMCPRKDKINEIVAMLSLKHYVFEIVYGIKNYWEKIKRGRYGKPYFPDESFEFNISGNKKSVVIAISPRGAIGIDAEPNRSYPGDVAKAFFSDINWKHISANREDFMKAWTRKEAYLKCIGTGWSVRSEADILSDVVVYEGKEYYLEDIDVSDDISLSLCHENIGKRRKYELHKLSLKDIYRVYEEV